MQVAVFEEINSQIDEYKEEYQFMVKRMNEERDRLLKVVDKQTKDIAQLKTVSSIVSELVI